MTESRPIFPSGSLNAELDAFKAACAGDWPPEAFASALDGFGFGYQKFSRRAEDWAMVGVCALVRRAGDGSCS